MRITTGWLIITAIMAYVFTPIVRSRLDLPLGPSFVVSLGVPLLLAVSVLVHELAHGITAQRLGITVREYVITLWGGHTTFTSEITRPGASALVAVAGPASNIALAALGWFLAPALGPIGGFLAFTLALTNAFVGAFNLLPASPLDGGKLLEAAIWKITGDRWTGMRVAGRLGQVTAVVVMVAFVAWPAYTGTQGTFSVITGLIVAWVIWQGATQTVKAARVRSATTGFDLTSYLVPAQVLSPEETVSRIRTFPALVDGSSEQGRTWSIIDAGALASVPADRRDTLTVDAVSTPVRTALVTDGGGPAAVTQIAGGLNSGAKLFLYAPRSGPARPTGETWVIDIDRVLAELKRLGA